MGARWRHVRGRALMGVLVVLVGAVGPVGLTGVGGTAGPGGVGAVGATSAQPAPAITVTPSTGLAIGDTVTVTGTGFPPPNVSLPVEVALCAESPVEDLEPVTVTPGMVEPLCAARVARYSEEDGSFTVQLPVTTARAPVVWAGTSAVTGPFQLDFHARVATAPVQVTPPAGDRVAVSVAPAERYAGHGVTLRATYEGALPEPGSTQVAECGAGVLDAPADPVVVASSCDGGSIVATTPDAVGEVVAPLPASAGTAAVWAGGRSAAGTMLAGAAPLTVHDPQVTVTPATGLVAAQQVRVQADELLLPTEPFGSGWEVRQCDRAILDRLPHAFPVHADCGPSTPVGEADAAGALDATFTVQRYVEVDRYSSGQRIVDCAAAPDACVALVAGRPDGEVREVGFAAPLRFAPAPPVVVALLAGAVVEGDAGTTIAQVPVVLDRPVDHPVTIVVRTFDNHTVPWAARSGEDYRRAEATVTIPAGATTAAMPVEVVGDTRPEPPEMALVGIWETTGAAVGGFAGIGGIQVTDDD